MGKDVEMLAGASKGLSTSKVPAGHGVLLTSVTSVPSSLQ